MLHFLLNHQDIQLQHFAAQTTLLAYLRAEGNLCGTKEGCASGDCGACTVVVASLAAGELRYRSINSCITFLGALHGQQVITVEYLAEPGGEQLHAVQQAMVDCHASQCGFCTPGFVMSLFALYKNPPAAADGADAADAAAQQLRRVHEYLAGNLCRCTGYRPIVDAAMAATQRVVPDHFDAHAPSVIDKLRAILADTPPGTADFLLPQGVDELAAQFAQRPQARLVGGGTDVALEVTQQLRDLPSIIALGQVAELRTIAELPPKAAAPRSVEIGAAVCLSECLVWFAQHYPSVADMLERFGATQVRNQGTIGGNIANASPIGDLPPVLIALDARVVLQQGQVLRVLPIDDFFVDYKQTVLQRGEFIRAVRLPLPQPGQVCKVYKVSKRLDDDISAVCFAIWVEWAAVSKGAGAARGESRCIAAVRLAFGGLAAVPQRAPKCEQALCGRFDAPRIAAAQQALLQDFSPLSDARASAAYRMQVAQNLLQRFYLEVSQEASQEVGQAGAGVGLQVKDVA